MKLAITGLLVLSVAPFALQGSFLPQGAMPAPQVANSGGVLGYPHGKGQPRSQTLRQEDFIQHSFSLATGNFGSVIQDHIVKNFDSELDFGAYYPDQFLAGIQGGQVGDILDLGTSSDLSARYGYQETVGGGQGFSSIRFESGELVILDDLSAETVQPFTEGQAFLDIPIPSFSTPAPVLLGHVYLIRILDRNDPRFFRLAKLLVTNHETNRQVTFTWMEIELN